MVLLLLYHARIGDLGAEQFFNFGSAYFCRDREGHLSDAPLIRSVDVDTQGLIHRRSEGFDLEVDPVWGITNAFGLLGVAINDLAVGENVACLRVGDVEFESRCFWWTAWVHVRVIERTKVDHVPAVTEGLPETPWRSTADLEVSGRCSERGNDENCRP